MSSTSSAYEISKRKVFLFLLLVIALVVMNAVLVLQNRDLKSADGRSLVLKPGKVVPALAGVDTNGRKVTFDYANDQRKTVLLVFSPRCTYCTENMPNWRAITQGLDAKSFRVVAVSSWPEGVKEYAADHGLTNVPVIAEPDPKNRVAYEMNMTPQTILIDPKGKVEKVWTGLIQEDERAEIEQALRLKLPSST
ncbi:MAG TPA: redoxin domain-containing protein [Pyrinomonadaceae bacterium]|nr:redoxin domain-containing protein [Pyrinomonadaceae bacterium]